MIKKQRQKSNSLISDLKVGNEHFEGDNLMDGWFLHFKNLATPTDCPDFNEQFYKLCKDDYNFIKQFTSTCERKTVSISLVRKALKHIHKGKSEDYFGLSVENLCHASDSFIVFLVTIINQIFEHQKIPEMLKTGLLTPIYKNKGDKKDSKNYRGITVLPILLKVIEYILREDLKEVVLPVQSPLQRGFTENSSPLNAAFLLEEFYRESKDLNKPVYIAFLDAKSAFDVVVREILMRKVYLYGINPASWQLIDDLHLNSYSVINWNNESSEKFEVIQGVKQGGLLSADLYKVYSNDMFDTLDQCVVGGRIGDIRVAAPGCCDDVAVQSNDPSDLQILVNNSKYYSGLHHYILQPQKSVVVEPKLIKQKGSPASKPFIWKLGEESMPIVKKAPHLGICRSSSIKKTEQETVKQNISKSQRAAYSLYPVGLHGENGLDPETCLHLISIYILPVLTYGLEIILPESTGLQALELCHRKFLKRILSLPKNTPDPAVYVLSGFIPVEGQVHMKALTFLITSVDRKILVEKRELHTVN